MYIKKGEISCWNGLIIFSRKTVFVLNARAYTDNI